MSGIITGPHFDKYFGSPTAFELGTMVAVLEIGAFGQYAWPYIYAWYNRLIFTVRFSDCCGFRAHWRYIGSKVDAVLRSSHFYYWGCNTNLYTWVLCYSARSNYQWSGSRSSFVCHLIFDMELKLINSSTQNYSSNLSKRDFTSKSRTKCFIRYMRESLLFLFRGAHWRALNSRGIFLDMLLLLYVPVDPSFPHSSHVPTVDRLCLFVHWFQHVMESPFVYAMRHWCNTCCWLSLSTWEPKVFF